MSQLEAPLISEAEEVAHRTPRATLRDRLLEWSPILAVVVVVVAISIGFVARNVTVSQGPSRPFPAWAASRLDCLPLRNNDLLPPCWLENSFSLTFSEMNSMQSQLEALKTTMNEVKSTADASAASSASAASIMNQELRHLMPQSACTQKLGPGNL